MDLSIQWTHEQGAVDIFSLPHRQPHNAVYSFSLSLSLSLWFCVPLEEPLLLGRPPPPTNSAFRPIQF